jgi:hypothetical protein
MPTRYSSNARWWIEQRLRPFETSGSPCPSAWPTMSAASSSRISLSVQIAQAVAVGEENGAAELRLVDALLDQSHDVAPLDRVTDVDGLPLVERPGLKMLSLRVLTKRVGPGSR